MDQSSKDERISELEDTVDELIDRIDELEQELYDGRLAVEKKISEANKRITTLETKTSTASLSLESELTQMERYLCGIDEPPSSVTAERAYLLASNWKLISSEVPVGHVANTKNNNITELLEAAVSDRENKSVSFSPKQVHRAMEELSNLFESKAYVEKGKNNCKQIVIEDPDDILWSEDELTEALAHLDGGASP